MCTILAEFVYRSVEIGPAEEDRARQLQAWDLMSECQNYECQAVDHHLTEKEQATP